ncbi:MAG: hypothetical protein FWF91_01935 [Coriobacteriia bacterium]|nr:hypothetical protein [Coriobacteriia bacterium]
MASGFFSAYEKDNAGDSGGLTAAYALLPLHCRLFFLQQRKTVRCDRLPIMRALP